MAKLLDFVPETGAVFTPAGGTPMPILHLGNTLTERSAMINNSDPALRRFIDWSTKPAKASANAPGGYTQRRQSVFIRMPILLANGKYTTCTAQIITSVDPEMIGADEIELHDLMHWCLLDADTLSFWYSQSVE